MIFLKNDQKSPKKRNDLKFRTAETHKSLRNFKSLRFLMISQKIT